MGCFSYLLLVGFAVMRNGLPLHHLVFLGNVVHVTTVASVKQDLKGWRLNRCVFADDAGMVWADNHTNSRHARAGATSTTHARIA